ncbi:S-adenosyl-L-methionine-dependent methyltransferase [Rhodocollybia butyracea]|uniref:S-adenosyl-L-methionine-dependent methyltransferase n=1 Tax=Rhodocollybia butyracea TaxID=206335 RepID=A0A9P5UB80_9AGAR|nr:S-adenosyl-L-methionine-dependent methyltransferase [Rhodocollybia butyracea]
MEESPIRHYASAQSYLLPADSLETARLNLQHCIITKAFEDRLALAPVHLKPNDRVLESGAGTGIWALEFSAFGAQNNSLLDIECIDISDKQFPLKYPTNIHFSIQSVTNLPVEWKNSFSYVHQRLLVTAMNDSRWNQTINQLFDVLAPGGWVELVEVESANLGYGVGPYSKRLVSLITSLYKAKGVIGNLGVYLPNLLEKVGFVDIHCESRRVPIHRSHNNDGLNRSKQYYDLWMGIKAPVLAGGGYGIVENETEYDQLLQGCLNEWDESNVATTTYYTIVARKP